MDPKLHQKMSELIDRQEIWTVMLRYGRGLDRMDRALLRSCYWDDAIDDHHGFVGTPDAFIQWAFEFNQTTHVQHHSLGNHLCELDGDNAHAETHYTYIGAHLALPHLLSIGRYIDHFQRREGVWKMANRVTVIEKNFALADFPADAEIRSGDTRHGPLKPATRDQNDVSYERPVLPRQPFRQA